MGAPLLRLMLGPWGQEPLVAERCCRLLHWLCARAPENREILAAHCSPGASGARSISFIDAVLGAALALAGEALDAVAVRSVCRWLPGVSGQVRQACSRLDKKGEDDSLQVHMFKPVPGHDDGDVHMDDV